MSGSAPVAAAVRSCLLTATTILIFSCTSATQAPVQLVTPDFETAPVASDGDAADDPAILVGESAVRLLGTNKQAGLALYDLSGDERAFLASGRVNNVDALHLGGDEFLVAASNRTAISLDLYSVNVEQDFLELIARQPLDMVDPYGLCMGRTPEASVFVGDKEGRVEHWLVDEGGNFERRAVFQLASQTEGCVYDPVDGTLYVGEEARGIWAFDLAGGAPRLVAPVDGLHLVADVEGLDIYHRGEAGGRYLIASSQGDNSYLVYGLPGGERLLKFRIVGDRGAGIDGTEDTDGIAVTSEPLPGYPEGILVVQDGYNDPKPQNFKGVDWRKIQALLP